MSDTISQKPSEQPGASPSCAEAPGSVVWDQYFCTALLAQMSSQTLHDEPHLWQPYQAELSAKMADVMMAERAKRYPQNTEVSNSGA